MELFLIYRNTYSSSLQLHDNYSFRQTMFIFKISYKLMEINFRMVFVSHVNYNCVICWLVNQYWQILVIWIMVYPIMLYCTFKVIAIKIYIANAKQLDSFVRQCSCEPFTSSLMPKPYSFIGIKHKQNLPLNHKFFSHTNILPQITTSL